MTVYNINLGIGWASSGVEYAQAYRAKLFQQKQIDAKFIFTDFISYENISDLTRNIGILDEQVIWLYSHFTDQAVGPTTFSLSDLQALYGGQLTRQETVDEKTVRFYYEQEDVFLTAYLAAGTTDKVHRVEFVSRGNLIRKDYFQSQRLFTEYYTPRDNKAYLYQRRFFNQDGTIAYDEIIDDQDSAFRFADAILSSKEELIVRFMQSLKLTAEDFVILDRSTGTGQAVFAHVKPAKLGIVVHAEHFSENAVTDQTILWNNYYDYQFTNADKVDVFINSTDKQSELLAEQFAKYTPHRPYIVTIPVGSIDEVKRPQGQRKPYSIITASRLAAEKHVDWLAKAVILARESLPQLTFDIYGSGGEEDKIRKIIEANQAQDYIKLCGHKDLSDVYQDYELYLSGSKSEGFGLTLLEAIGAGLPLIGFDVRYGNQTFIRHGQNGYLIPPFETDDEDSIAQALAEKLIETFSQQNLDDFHRVSYEIAQDFLTSKVEAKWLSLVEEMTKHD